MTQIKNLKKMYGERCVLDIENLTLEQGESLAVVGANGSGKSTLLKILAGIIKPTCGTAFHPEKVLYLPQKSYAFQGSVLENVCIGLKNQKAKALDMLESFELAELKDKKASSLSGGEMQRLALCRLMMRPCGLLLLDEPTSACDMQSAETVIANIKKYCSETGCTLILSTHSPAAAANSAQKMMILNNGRPEALGETAYLVNNPPSEWTERFIAGWKI